MVGRVLHEIGVTGRGWLEESFTRLELDASCYEDRQRGYDENDRGQAIYLFMVLGVQKQVRGTWWQ